MDDIEFTEGLESLKADLQKLLHNYWKILGFFVEQEYLLASSISRNDYKFDAVLVVLSKGGGQVINY